MGKEFDHKSKVATKGACVMRQGSGTAPGRSVEGAGAVVSRLSGALLRALMVVLLVAIPSLVVPSVSADSAQIVALIALFAAALTLFEYGSVYPGIVEFRDAPPFNRIRFVALFATVLLLSVGMLADFHHTTLTRFVDVLGTAVARSIDLPYSPVRLLVLMLPSDADPLHLDRIRSAAGISYLISLIALGYFVLILRMLGWPNCNSFNLWVNLPTFDPTAGGDIVERLRRDAWVNVALGFLLPFIIPAVVKAISLGFSPVTLESPHTMVWTVTAWAFLPASLFMRGIALGRIAGMIEAQRAESRLREFATA